MQDVSISREIAREYDRRRRQTEDDRDRRRQQVYAQYPDLARLDRAIAEAGADLLLETIEPGRPARASQRKAELTAQRAERLASLGIAPDFDQLRPVCARCLDTGMIGHRRCDCYRQILVPLLTSQANLRALAGIHFDQFDPSLFSDQPDPARYHSDYSPRTQMLGIRQACERYVQEFDHLDQNNLLFVGRPGTGKTFLMACVANALLTQGRSVLYLTAPGLFEIMTEYRTILATFTPDEIRLERLTALHDAILNCDLLLIDDLGTEPTAANRYADLLGILDSRSLPGLHTMISSNAEPAALRDAYDERLLSRLMGGFAIYRFFGDDVRLLLNRRRRRQGN